MGSLLARGVSIRTLIPAGLFIIAAAITWMGFAWTSSPFVFFLVPLLLCGVGLMFAQTPAARIFVSKSPPDLVGALGSSRTFFGQFGFALGVALSSSILYGLFSPELHSQLVRAGAAPGDLSRVSGIVQSYVSVGNVNGFNAEFASVVLGKAVGSYLFSYRVTMLVLASVIGVSGAVCLWQLPRRKSGVSK